jgi:hypothetical protein
MDEREEERRLEYVQRLGGLPIKERGYGKLDEGHAALRDKVELRLNVGKIPRIDKTLPVEFFPDGNLPFRMGA